MTDPRSTKEILLTENGGTVTVKANGVRVEIHNDGSVLAYTKADVKKLSDENNTSADAKEPNAKEPHGNDQVPDGASQVSDRADPTASCEQPSGPRIGAMMTDCTVYAGISPDTGKPMYAMPADASLTLTFNEARKHAKTRNARNTLDHDDWRVPTKSELNELFNNRAAIGGFDVTGSGSSVWYWSSSSDGIWNAWGQRFSDARQDYYSKDLRSSVRLVRG